MGDVVVGQRGVGVAGEDVGVAQDRGRQRARLRGDRGAEEEDRERRRRGQRAKPAPGQAPLDL